MTHSSLNSEIIPDEIKSSPDAHDRVLDARIHIKERQQEAAIDQKRRVFKSCCFELDREIFIFSVQSVLIGGLLIYSAYNIAHEDTCEKNTIWYSLLTLLLGIMCPSPKI
jgi:hypothetical protein